MRKAKVNLDDVQHHLCGEVVSVAYGSTIGRTNVLLVIDAGGCKVTVKNGEPIAYVIDSLHAAISVLQDKSQFRPFARGDAIVMVPDHVNYREPSVHDELEIGFVTSVSKDGETVFCRFWSKEDPDQLRTEANSEGVHPRHLRHYYQGDEERIIQALEWIEREDGDRKAEDEEEVAA